jgi:hypothetical protein
MTLKPMKMKIISLEIYLPKITLVYNFLIIKSFLLFIDSELEDSKGFGKLGFTGGFGLGSGTPYGGTFSNAPDRVGSAPATDLTVVR